MKGDIEAYTMFCFEAYETDIMSERCSFNDIVH